MQDINAFKIEQDHTFDTDICIVGGGAAGIAIAREFIGTDQKVLVLESGSYSSDEKTQSLYDFESVGHPVRAQDGYVSRNRYLGGSTNTWAGRCAPLNRIDYEQRDWVPDSGWPITYDCLDEYNQKASAFLKLTDFNDFIPKHWENYLLGNKHNFLADETFNLEVFLLARKPVNVRLEYIEELQAASNIQVCINANVTEIEPSSTLTTVNKLHVTSFAGNNFFVNAKIYILACGGWENTRLLLLSRRYCADGLGNQNDVVGRYYMEHPKIKLGYITPTTNTFKSPILLGRKKIHRGSLIHKGSLLLGIKLADQIQREERLLNHYVELFPMYPDGMTEAINAFSKSFSAQAIKNNLTKFSPFMFQWAEFFARMYLNMPIQYERVAITSHFEHAPNRESRIMLGNQRDALGLNRLKVNLKISSEEKRSIVRFHEILSKVLQEQGLGHLTSEFPDAESFWPDLTDSSHHMGTTRMSLDPKKGVVDENCRVHGMNNLYVASSSVFPTVGHVNPTMTIVALSLRLADHLKNIAVPKLSSLINV
ncbi:MAG: GMC family oxidoreductase [Symploca sp. SIO3E6]|nr:GMC family oxidoreductase [Caldora sp. SIO3E6]